jgi:hypothetical protein
MENSRIIQIIENPEKLKFSDKNYIEDLITKYPFTQSFHLVYLNWKNAYISNPLNKKDIQKISIYTTYRELIKRSMDITNRKLVKPIITGNIIREEKNKISQIEENIILENIVSNKFMEEDNNSTKLSGIDSNCEKIISEVKTTEEFLSGSSEKMNFQAVEDNTKIQLLSSNKEELSNKSNFLNNDISSYTNIERLGISHLFTSNFENGIFETCVNKEEIYEIQNTKLEELNEKDGESKIKEANLNEQNIEIEKDEITQELEKLTFSQWISLSKQKIVLQAKKVISPQERQNNIISNFIENNPKIKPVAKDTKYIKDVEFKKEEIQDIANLMTITLAQLYVEQGKYDTALTAFKILSLKYPEKSSFFASEIRRIKKIKNSK